ncbi:MAG: hypothetical protein JWQ78_1417, partial [Sediminibacterium sp.]|nr:hypothetical protein [Sediminibacterium sp.]
HKGFFTRLEEKFPGLSLADTRLLALVKLGLSNIEMTRMMGMSAVVIEVAKQRLAQKINTAAEELGIEYLVQAI